MTLALLDASFTAIVRGTEVDMQGVQPPTHLPVMASTMTLEKLPWIWKMKKGTAYFDYHQVPTHPLIKGFPLVYDAFAQVVCRLFSWTLECGLLDCFRV